MNAVYTAEETDGDCELNFAMLSQESSRGDWEKVSSSPVGEGVSVLREKDEYE